MPSTVTVTARTLVAAEERDAAARLYRQVFGLADTDAAMTPKLLAALQHHGGSAVGAFDGDDELIGFAYGFVGLDDHGAYHHSQAAVVAPAHQGRGIGRELKLAQAEVARSTGVGSMRWAYDPMHARNAHFNLDVLGATGRWFHRDYYGMNDELGRTDRVLVEWPVQGQEPALRTTHELAVPQPVPAWSEVVRDGADTWLAIPADWNHLAHHDPERAATLRNRTADQLESLLTQGRALVSCARASEATAVYRIGEVSGD